MTKASRYLAAGVFLLLTSCGNAPLNYGALEPTIDVAATDTVVDLPATLAALDRHFSTRRSTLAPPLSADEIDRLETELPCPLPPLLKAMYRWHDGVDAFEPGYDWLSLGRVVAESRQWRTFHESNWRDTYLPLLMLDSSEYLVLDCGRNAPRGMFRYHITADRTARYRGPGHWLSIARAAYDNGGYRYDEYGYVDESPLLVTEAYRLFETAGESATRERNWARFEPHLRSASGEQLRMLGNYMPVLADERAVPILRARLHDAGDDDLAHILFMLGELRVAEAQTDMAALVDHPSPQVRNFAAFAIAKTGPIQSPSTIDRLIAQIDDRDDLARLSAIGALGTSGSPRAVEPLLRALPASRSGLQYAIVDALVRLGDKSALPALRQLQTRLEDADPSQASKGGTRGSDVVPRVLKAAVDKAITDLGG